MALWFAVRDATPAQRTPRPPNTVVHDRLGNAPPVPALASPQRLRLPDDPNARAQIVESVTSAPTPDDIALLRELIAYESDGRVRERAIIAYGEALGTDALPALRDVALSDPDERAMAAAQATVYRIRNEHPAAPRARIDVSTPEAFVPGAPIDLVIRYAVDEFAPKARFALRIPRDVELLGGDPLEWAGSLAAGQIREHHLRVRTSAPVVLRARFSADFPEALDAETVQLRLVIDDGTITASTQLARN